MTRSIRFAVGAALVMAAMQAMGCGPEPKKKDGEPEHIPIDVGGAPCPEGNILSWENFGEAFIVSQCTACHSADLAEGMRQNAPIGVDFGPNQESGLPGADYEMVRTWGSRIYGRSATTVGGMPPAGGPTDLDRANLGYWMACDAPREEDLPQ